MIGKSSSFRVQQKHSNKLGSEYIYCITNEVNSVLLQRPWKIMKIWNYFPAKVLSLHITLTRISYIKKNFNSKVQELKFHSVSKKRSNFYLITGTSTSERIS